MKSSPALRVLMLGSVSGEEWLRERLACLVPPADLYQVSTIGDIEPGRSARYDLILTSSTYAQDVMQRWPEALACEPMVYDDIVHLNPLKPEQRSLALLIEQQLYHFSSDPFATQTVRQFQAMRQVNQALGSVAGASSKLEQVIKAVIQLIGADYGAAFLFDKTRQYMDIVADSENGYRLIGHRVAVDASAIGQKVLRGQPAKPFVLPLSAERELPLLSLESEDVKLLPEGCTEAVCIPLVGQTGSVGGLLLYRMSTAGFLLTDATAGLLETIASQSAVAVEDSLLFSAARRMAEQMELVNRVSREIVAIHDLDTILSIIPDRLTETFGYYHASVGVISNDSIEMYEASQRSRAVGPERFRISLDAGGMVPWVAQTGQARLANDTRRDEIWVPGKGLEASRSELTVPLIYRDRIIGLIDVQSEHLSAFDQNDIFVLEALAGQLVIAIENARLYDENRHQQQVAETLSRVSRLAGSMRDVHDVSETVLVELSHLLPFDSAFISLLENDTLRIVHHKGYAPEELAAIRWLMEDSPLPYQVLRSQERMLISDTSEHQLWQKAKLAQPPRSWLGVPLISQGSPIGILSATRLAPHAYLEPDGDLLFAFANQIVVSIDNAQLFQKIERREREARTLYEITRLLVSLDQDAIPLSVLGKLGEVIPFDAAGMLIGGEPDRVIIIAKRSVTEMAIKEIEERLIHAYNALTDGQLSSRSVQRRVISVGPGAEARQIEHLPSRLSSPLLIGRHVIGVIELGHADTGVYAETELRTLFIITNLTATALENARLYQELVARAVNLQHAIDELAEVDRLKDELVQNISHELRTPLTLIAGYIDLLLRGELGALQPEQESSLKLVAAKTKTLERLVSDILLLERTSTKGLELSAVNMAELAKRAVQGIQVSSSEAGISLVTEIDPDVGPVMADPDRIGQVFDNLLGNALKFSSSGDTITVRVKQQEQGVRVEVEDTGIGIALDKLPHIFERFYQADVTSRRHGGVGLGLAICKQIIEAHSGQIGVQSEQGVGSLFYFELPLA